MRIYSFFKLLNNKIKQYEKAASNPYNDFSKNVTVIWIEDVKNDNKIH